KDARHAAHSPTAEAPQDTQRGGSRRSTSHAVDGTRESVNRLCRLRVETRAGRRGNELASICDVSATLSPRLTAPHDDPHTGKPRLIGRVGRALRQTAGCSQPVVRLQELLEVADVEPLTGEAP